LHNGSINNGFGSTKTLDKIFGTLNYGSIQNGFGSTKIQIFDSLNNGASTMDQIEIQGILFIASTRDQNKDSDFVHWSINNGSEQRFVLV